MQHRHAIPQPLLGALVVDAVFWGWDEVAVLLLSAWSGLLRPDEIISARRCRLILPQDVRYAQPFALLEIKKPKSRWAGALHQAAKIDDVDVVACLVAVCGSKSKDGKLWQFSPATFSKRFKQLCNELHVPSRACYQPRWPDRQRMAARLYVLEPCESKMFRCSS